MIAPVLLNIGATLKSAPPDSCAFKTVPEGSDMIAPVAIEHWCNLEILTRHWNSHTSRNPGFVCIQNRAGGIGYHRAGGIELRRNLEICTEVGLAVGWNVVRIGGVRNPIAEPNGTYPELRGVWKPALTLLATLF